MVLEAAPEVSEPDCRAGACDAAVFCRMQPLFARVDEDTVSVGESLVLHRLPRLAPVVEGHGVAPHILVPITLLLRIVLPVYAVPVEIDPDAVLEAAPDDRARVRRRCIDNKRPRSWPPAVVDPPVTPAGTFLARQGNVIELGPRIPDIDRTIECLGILVSHEDRQCPARARV